MAVLVIDVIPIRVFCVLRVQYCLYVLRAQIQNYSCSLDRVALLGSLVQPNFSANCLG